MIKQKTAEEIERLRQGGTILARILNNVITAVKPGVSTKELNDLSEKLIREAHAKPSFKNYQGYPASLCASVNSQVVHAIPSPKQILREGDIITLDLGIWYQGLCTDMARTAVVGKISKDVKKLVEVTKEALRIGTAQVKPGNRIGDISAAVQKYVESNSFSVIRTLFGHGVGYQVHEEPRIPNFGQAKTGPLLQPGMVIALEPMVAIGQPDVKTADDGWSVEMADGSWAAHCEDTIVVTEQGFEVLTKP
ncbi:MAG: type I methionyl aminopeptidase [Patescibacteria group bacterium]|nr:type I methionyl aminopeptidase [Patescibacteria group bacterium]